MAKIFILDDDPAFCEMMSYHFSILNHDTTWAHSLKQGLETITEFEPDVVFLDVRLPDGSGLEYIQEIRNAESNPEVLIITGEGDPDGAELAIRTGAWDYIEKPSTMSQITLPMVRALEYRLETRSGTSALTIKRDGIIGESPVLQQCLDKVAYAVEGSVSVLISGETGTGKELFARAIHQNSSRSGKNMVVVDCAALPDNLVESILFGYEKGAFTGASSAKDGLVKDADGGILFLDEVGELPYSVQKSFLRVLQEHRFRPVGSNKELTSDFRLIAATNRNLDEQVKENCFREDLLYRLKGMTIKIPPLRERKEDIPELVDHYLSKVCARAQISAKQTTPEFLELLGQYDWPGNVRELVNTIEAAVSLSKTSTKLFTTHLPTTIRLNSTRLKIGKNRAIPSISATGETKALKPYNQFKAEAVEKIEKQYLSELLSASGRNQEDAMEIAGLSRSRLYELLKKHNLSFK